MENNKKAPGGNQGAGIDLSKYNIDFRPQKSICFKNVNATAIASIRNVLAHWLPNGRTEGHEYVALNPTRIDRSLGSFRINLKTGRWCDFATGDAGGDLISLVSYLTGTTQIDAAKQLKKILGE